MISTITDLALDLGQFALDNELENERTRPTGVVLEARHARASAPPSSTDGGCIARVAAD